MAETLKDFLVALVPEVEASRLVSAAQARHEQRAAAAAEPPDTVLAERIATLEEECAELGKRVRDNRESVPRLVVQRLEDKQSEAITCLLAQSEPPAEAVEETRPIELKAEVERSSELCTKTDSSASAVRSAIAATEQRQQLLEYIRSTEAGSVDAAIANANKENDLRDDGNLDDTFHMLHRHVR